MRTAIIIIITLVAIVGVILLSRKKDTVNVHGIHTLPDGGKCMRVVISPEFPPFAFKNDEGKLQGIDVDIINYIAARLDMTVDYVEEPFVEIFDSLKRGEAACGVSGITITAEREEKVDFTEAYYTANQLIVVPGQSNVNSAEALEGLVIGVKNGTTGESLVSKMDAVASIERYDSTSELFLALLQGKVEAVVIDNEPARRFVLKNSGKIRIVETPLSNEQYGIAFEKGQDELRNKFNLCLADMWAIGEMEAIFAKWVTSDVQ